MAESAPLDWIAKDQEVCICLDWDDAGHEATRLLWHRCIDAGLTPSVVDRPGGDGIKDINDLLIRSNPAEFTDLLRNLSTSLMVGESVFLPDVEFKLMRSVIAHVDTMTSVKIEDGAETEGLVAGMRPYRIDTMLLHNPATAMTGTYGHPERKSLIHYRRVDSPVMLQHALDAGDLGKPATWQGLSWIYSPYIMSAATQALARGQRRITHRVPVVGLVHTPSGVVFQDGYDAGVEPDQSPYSGLNVGAGSPEDAAALIMNMRGLLVDDLALMILAWAVGACVKSLAGFYPHLIVSSPASSGKTTMLDLMARATMAKVCDFSELETGYRRMRLLANHIMPVFVDEASRASRDATVGFLDLLNAAYMGTLRHHSNHPNLLGGAVAMVGQDSPTSDAAILSKTVILDISRAKGTIPTIRHVWPYREWGRWIASTHTKASIQESLQARMVSDAKALKLGVDDGDVSERLRRNYALLGFVVDEIFAFANMKESPGQTVTRPWLSSHIRNTTSLRRESTAIMDQLARDLVIDHRNMFPHKVIDDELIIPPSAILDYLHSRGHRFAINSSRRLVDHLEADGYLLRRGVQQSINGIKHSACVVLSLRMLGASGIHWPLIDTLA